MASKYLLSELRLRPLDCALLLFGWVEISRFANDFGSSRRDFMTRIVGLQSTVVLFL